MQGRIRHETDNGKQQSTQHLLSPCGEVDLTDLFPYPPEEAEE